MSPRSRRIDTSVIAATGFFSRPTTKRLLTPSTSRAGIPDADRPDRGRESPAGRRLQLVDEGGAVTVDSRVRGGVDMERAAGLVPTVRRWASRLVVSSWSAVGGREGHQKSRGPDLAHGSWFCPEGGRAACG